MKNLLSTITQTEMPGFNSYRTIAEKLMNDYQLRVRNKFYRIIDCEFYYNSNNHEDPYTHGHERQKESIGEWYFHGSVLDITLSNGEAFGGILIRAIIEVGKELSLKDRKGAIMGPLNVCTEIFKQIGNVMADGSLHFGLVDSSHAPSKAKMEPAKVFAVPRIGLNPAREANAVYCNRPYRFITFLHLPHRDSERIKKYLLGITNLFNLINTRSITMGKNGS